MRSTPDVARETDMRWIRLQHLLRQLEPGETVTIGDVAAKTGLGMDSVDTVLRALTRAALFTQSDPTTFVRHRLLRGTDS
jgi:hypothetical protein